jgi:hypothetical protein
MDSDMSVNAVNVCSLKLEHFGQIAGLDHIVRHVLTCVQKSGKRLLHSRQVIRPGPKEFLSGSLINFLTE